MHDHTTGVTVMTTDTTHLTDLDRWTIAEVRKLAAMSPVEICLADGMPPSGCDPAAYAFGRVGPLLRDLADLAERLGGDGA